MKVYEVRDPIHGFIPFDEREKKIINHPCFQRLRRINQLSWACMSFPGAMHTRFEHSLGVMHLSTRMFDAIVGKARNKKILKDIGISTSDLKRDRIIVRLAGLLHDIGHAPFSHAGEEVFPIKTDGKRYKHEDYSVKIIELLLKNDIEELYKRERIKVEEICSLLDGRLSKSLIWMNLISSQLDADRGDYLLRDSYHLGVKYGFYDLDRLLNTITLIENERTGDIKIGVEFGGFHIAESLIIARYMMFTQVYFQHTVRAYSKHITEAMKEILHGEGLDYFPPPIDCNNLKGFMEWDDWKAFGLLKSGKGGEHGKRITDRMHYRRIYETVECPGDIDISLLPEVEKKFKGSIAYIDAAEKSWYKLGEMEIPVLSQDERNFEKLARLSNVVGPLKDIRQHRMYTAEENNKKVNKLKNRISEFVQSKKDLIEKYKKRSLENVSH